MECIYYTVKLKWRWINSALVSAKAVLPFYFPIFVNHYRLWSDRENSSHWLLQLSFLVLIFYKRIITIVFLISHSTLHSLCICKLSIWLVSVKIFLFLIRISQMKIITEIFISRYYWTRFLNQYSNKHCFPDL